MQFAVVLNFRESGKLKLTSGEEKRIKASFFVMLLNF